LYVRQPTKNFHKFKRGGGKMKKIIATFGMFFLLAAGFEIFSTNSQEESERAPLNPAFLRAIEKIQHGEYEWVTEDGYSLGHIPGPVDRSYLYSTAPALKSTEILALPATYDLRSTGRITSVKDQSTCGACWTFAGVGSAESYLRPGETRNFSEQHLNAYHPFDWAECAGGNSDIVFAMWGNWSGIYNETDYPYPYSGDSFPRDSVAVAQKHVQEAIWPPDDASTLKNLVMSGGGLYVSFYWSAAFHNYTTKAYYYTGSSDTNHAVVLAGWDDNFPASSFNTTPPGNGAWLIKNSWGESHSMTDGTGYFWISYYDSSFGNPAAFHNAEPTDNYDALYAHDEYGHVWSWTYPWGANIFTATDNHYITAVGILPTSGCSYTVKVYTGCSSTDPVSGSLASTNTGSVTMGGYYTIPLDTPVSVTSGQRFSVVVQYTAAGTYPLATEGIYAGYSSGCTSSAGESFYSSNGTTWTDFLTGWPSYACNNVIKAYAGGKATKNDFNGDGKGDIVWRNYSHGQNAVWYMNYSGAGMAGMSPDSFEMMETVEDPGQTEMLQNPLEERATLKKNMLRAFRNPMEPEGIINRGLLEVFQSPAEGENLVYETEEYVFDRKEAGGAKEISVMTGPADEAAIVGIQALWRTGTAYLTTVTDTNWHIVGTGDFNGDKQIDILWRNYSSGLNVVWYMNGVTRTATVYLTTVTDTNWEIVGTGDVNGDDKTDIIWRNSSSGLNVVWYMDGATRTATVYLTTVTDTNWRIVGATDTNEVGKIYILWRNYVDGRNAVWFMDGATRTGTAYLTTVTDTNWYIVGTGDCNADGKIDILWRNYINGLNVVWYMDGVTRTATEYLTTVTDTNWRIENR